MKYSKGDKVMFQGKPVQVIDCINRKRGTQSSYLITQFLPANVIHPWQPVNAPYFDTMAKPLEGMIKALFED